MVVKFFCREVCRNESRVFRAHLFQNKGGRTARTFWRPAKRNICLRFNFGVKTILFLSHQNRENNMMNELEFAREKYRQLMMMMPILVAEVRAKAKSELEAQALIDVLLDKILDARAAVKRLENSKKNR